MAVGPSSGWCVWQGQTIVNETYSPGTVWPTGQHQDLCWCFSIWFGSSASPAALRHALEASHICIPFNQWHRTEVLPNQKGGPGKCMCLWEVSHLCFGQGNPLGNCSQTPSPTPQQDQPQLLASTSPSIQATPLQIWLHHQPCPRKVALHFPVLQKPLPVVPISRKKRRQSSSLAPLFPPCQQAKTVWMSTGKLNKRTAPVASSSPSTNRDGLTDLSSREIYCCIGIWEETSPFVTTFSCTTGISLFPRACKPQHRRKKMHGGHQDIQRCHQCITSSVWWPGVSKHNEQLVKSCPNCAKASTLHKEPLMYSQIMHAWENFGLDLFELNGSTYLLVVDYSSCFIEIKKLSSINSRSVIQALTAILSRHGVPATLVSNNGPQYACWEMQKFAESYGFEHFTSSPHFPQSNGMAERSVKTVLSLMEKSSDPYVAILSYRATPLPWCNLSTAELLLGRRLKTDISHNHGRHSHQSDCICLV